VRGSEGGRAAAQAARVLSRVNSYGIYGGRSDAGTGFLRVLRFALSILISSTASYSSEARTLATLVTGVLSGLSSPPSHPGNGKRLLNRYRCQE
jgi:hypothetical protein